MGIRSVLSRLMFWRSGEEKLEGERLGAQSEESSESSDESESKQVVSCKECGKTFEAPNAGAKLGGHMGMHRN